MTAKRKLILPLVVLIIGCVAVGIYFAFLTPRSTRYEQFLPERDLIVFVGKRLLVRSQGVEGNFLMDQKFAATYRVLELLHGECDDRYITFTVYDHYGRPAFADFKTALLFVSRHNGQLYHEKYQFFEVHPTKEGRWATCGDPYKYESDVHRHGRVKPKKIEFAVDVRANDGHTLCSEGAYVEDLFQIKREGVLKSRGLFK